MTSPSPSTGPGNIDAQRSAILTAALSKLQLQWQPSVDLSQSQITSPGQPVFNRSYNIPDLTGDQGLYTAGYEKLGPLSGTLTVSEKIYQEMFPNGRWADIDFIAQARPQRPNPDNDPLWGIVNSPNILALLRAVDHVQPKNVLVIGGGVGLVESLMGQAMPSGSKLTVVDAGSQPTKYPITKQGHTYRRGIVDVGLFGFLNAAEKQGLLGPGSGHAEVQCHEEDSQVFLDRAQVQGRGQYDFVLIDGNHAYLNAVLDILKSFTLLDKNGLLFIDDWSRIYNSQGVIHGTGLLAYHAGVQVYSLEAKGNTVLVDSAGNPPNMVFAAKRDDSRRPIDMEIDHAVKNLLREIRR